MKNLITILCITCIFLFLYCSENGAESKTNSQYRILYTSRLDIDHIYSINEDGTDNLQHTNFENQSWWPVWAMKGLKIIFFNLSDYDLYSINFDGKDLKNLTNNSAQNIRPSMSPNGEFVVFQMAENGFSDICIIDINGNHFKNLTLGRNGSNIGPLWSPTGDKILYSVFTVIDGSVNLYVMNSDGLETNKITNFGITDLNYCWTPDGEQIVYVNENNRLRIINSNGTNDLLIGDTTKIARYPNCSASDSKVLIGYKGEIEDEIWTFNSDGTDPKKITDVFRLTQPVFSPDGKKILYTEGLNQIYIMDSDGSNKKKLTTNDHTITEQYYSWSQIKLVY